MKNRFLFLLLFPVGFTFGQLGVTAGPKENLYVYSLEPVLTAAKPYFKITIRYNSGASAKSAFQLPKVWGNTSSLDFIELDTIIGAREIPQKDSFLLQLEHGRKKAIEIRYKVYDAVSDSIPGHGEEYMPTIKNSYFSLFSNSVFLVPSDEKQHDYTFRVNWINYPAAYRREPLTSFGAGLEQELKHAGAPDLQNSVMVGGDYRLYEQENAQGQKIAFAIRGKWYFEDTAMFDLVVSTLKQQRLFWNDYSTKSYLVTMSAMSYRYEEEMSYTGTGLHNSFAVMALCNSKTQPADLAYLYHHELMHHWIGHRIANAADEELSYWFSEGFTDYFARRNMFESHILTEKQYHAVLDSVFAIHYNNPLSSAHNDSIRVHFWDDPVYSKLPYNRGSIFAYYLDCRIQSETKGKQDLKSVMQSMLRELNGKNKQFTRGWLQKKVLEIAKIDIRADIDRYVIRGEKIPPEAFSKVSLVKKQVKMQGFGFTYEKEADGKNWRVLTVDPDSGAGKAGLQAGDLVVGYSLFGDIHSLSELTVLREGVKHKLEFHAYVDSAPVPQHAE